ncbi:MAG: type II secretion system F family protein [Candidatus ainarchaeum sp.]|nr:type II secretion system F family protein [Candidatus ainarchaeum sp.]
MGFYQRVGAIVPSFIVRAFKKEMDYIGWEIQELSVVGFIFLFGAVLSIAISANLQIFFSLPIIATFPLIFLGFAGSIYYWLNTIAESRGKFVDKLLPDVLQLISSNMKSGLTTERALLASARPEFGVFSDELKLASGKVLAGERIEGALTDITTRIKSPLLERTMWLVVQGIRSGGEVADLLSQLADDLREENALKEETKAEVSMYIMLIFFGAAIGAPVLFSISSYIVGVLNVQTSQLSMNPEQLKEITQKSSITRIIGIPEISITEEFATMYALIALGVTCLFSSLIMGTINSGKEKDGIRYIPIVGIIAVALFFIIRIILVQVLGSLKMLGM